MRYLVHLAEAVLAINLLVLVHEFGHMLAARLFRVPSLRFSLGLGPKLMGFRFKGTDYCVASIPLGGFVQLATGHSHRSDTACMECLSPWKKIVVFFAGPAANLLFVPFLFWTVFCVLGYTDNVPVVRAVDPGSPAAQAGITAGNRILNIDGQRIISWSQVVVAFERADKPLKVVLGARKDSESKASGVGGPEILSLSIPVQGLAGAHPSHKMIRLRLGAVPAAKKSMEKLWTLSGILFESMTGLVTARISPSELVGPVYLFHLSTEAAIESQTSLVYLLAFVSASLCFFNLLPLPILDGGQISLAFIQQLLGRPLGPRSVKLLTHASLVWLFVLLAAATFNDLVRLVKL